MDLAKNFRHNVRSVLKEQKIGPKRLAELMGKPKSYKWLQRVVSGDVGPTLETIERISEALGKDPIAMLEE